MNSGLKGREFLPFWAGFPNGGGMNSKVGFSAVCCRKALHQLLLKKKQALRRLQKLNDKRMESFAADAREFLQDPSWPFSDVGFLQPLFQNGLLFPGKTPSLLQKNQSVGEKRELF